MVRTVVGMLVSLALALGGTAGCAAPAKMALGEIPRMGVDELKARLGEPGLVVIDVRASGDWESGSLKIKGAIREDSKKVSSWSSNYFKDKPIILYCT